MDIKQLTYFMAVAQAGSFSQAAEHLGISQPALSISVKNLEEELGVKLLYAFGRRQMLTDEGRRLLEGAQQLMDVYQKTVEDVRRTDRNSSGAFSLGLPPLMGACFFGDLIPEFNRAYPNIRVHMIEEGAHRLDQMLQAGELDLEPALEGRLAALTSQQMELGQAAGICRAMREDHVRYDTLDAPVYLDRMSQPERPSLTWREDPPPRAVFPWRRFWAGRSKTEWLPSKRFSPPWNGCLLCRRRPWCRLQLRRSLRTFLERCRSFPACRREGS